MDKPASFLDFDGPFRLDINGEALSVDLAALSDVERRQLTGGVAFDPTRHVVARFRVTPMPLPQKTSKKHRNKNAFKRVTEAAIEIHTHSRDIRLLGVLPRTLQANDLPQRVRDELELGVTPKLTISGGLSALLARDKQLIVNRFSDHWSGWAFSKAYVRTHQDFDFYVFCERPSDLPRNTRAFSCVADFRERGRVITSKKVTVRLP